MGAMLVHALAQAGVTFRLVSLGVHGEFGQSAYKASQLYTKHEMDTTAIVAAARRL